MENMNQWDSSYLSGMWNLELRAWISEIRELVEGVDEDLWLEDVIWKGNRKADIMRKLVRREF
jgi:hypothetical protein